jgi:hypothetical protein
VDDTFTTFLEKNRQEERTTSSQLGSGSITRKAEASQIQPTATNKPDNLALHIYILVLMIIGIFLVCDPVVVMLIICRR